MDICIHLIRFPGSLYEPPESWCELNKDECEDCPCFCSKEEYEDRVADRAYDIYKDSFFDF